MRKMLVKYNRLIPNKIYNILYLVLVIVNVCISVEIYGAEIAPIVSYSNSCTVLEEEIIENFHIGVGSPETVMLEILLCPARHSDGSFTEYNIYLNNSRVTSISPTLSGWQNIKVPMPISLNQGENILGIGVIGQELPDIGCVRTISGTVENRLESSNPVSTPHSFPVEVNSYNGDLIQPLLLTDSNETVYKINVPYTFCKLFRWEEGEIIDIFTDSNTSHLVDLFLFRCHSDVTHTIAPPTSSQMQGLNWRAESERGSVNQTARLRVRIPKSGFYMVSLKPKSSFVSGRVNMKINSELVYDDCPITSCAMISAAMIEQQEDYEIFMKMYDPDKRPLLRIEGNGASRVVGSSIQCPSEIVTGMGMKSTDAYLRQTYCFSPQQICVSAYTPTSVGYGEVLIRKFSEQIPSFLNSYEVVSNSNNLSDNVSRISVLDNKTIVIVGENAWDGIVLTDVYGNEVFRNMNSQKSYDVTSVISGYYTICLLHDGMIIENKKVWLY
ncbi:MAG: hypothetical protein K2O24_02105 [Muribaculaceae bacterium]|nr:hypothetical protein [Muribaculaceae bacterium]